MCEIDNCQRSSRARVKNNCTIQRVTLIVSERAHALKKRASLSYDSLTGLSRTRAESPTKLTRRGHSLTTSSDFDRRRTYKTPATSQFATRSTCKQELRAVHHWHRPVSLALSVMLIVSRVGIGARSAIFTAWPVCLFVCRVEIPDSKSSSHSRRLWRRRRRAAAAAVRPVAPRRRCAHDWAALSRHRL